jgi:hypothetical protein
MLFIATGYSFIIPSRYNGVFYDHTQSHLGVAPESSSTESDLSGRRIFLSAIVQLSFLTSANGALARDELFKPNPLTNPILEQVGVS